MLHIDTDTKKQQNSRCNSELRQSPNEATNSQKTKQNKSKRVGYTTFLSESCESVRTHKFEHELEKNMPKTLLK